MATRFSATVKATPQRPFILTHIKTGERYAFSARHLAHTRALYADAGLPKLETLYFITREWPPHHNEEHRAHE